MKTYDELLEETTFRTMHPGSGAFYLFIYWCNNEQHQSILTRRSKDILPIFLRKEAKDHHDPKELWFIEMVSPTPEYEMAWRRARLDQAIKSADMTARFMVDMAFDEGDPLPPNLSWCDEGYTPEDPDDPDMDLERDPRHYYCTRCDSARIVHTVDPVAIYQRAEALNRRPRREFAAPHPQRPVMRPNTPLFAFRCDGGHHEVGSMIQEIKSQEDFVSYLREPPLFLFHGFKLEIPEDVALYCKERGEAHERRASASDEAWRKRQEENDAYNVALVRYYFNGGDPPPEPRKRR